MKIAHSTIDSHLEKGLENIYTVFGNETLFIQETIEKIRAKAVKNGYTERSSIVVTKDFDWTTLTNASENLDLFGNMKILELKMLGTGPGVSGSKALKDYTGKKNDSQILIISAERLESKSLSSAWVKALDSNGILVTVKALDDNQIVSWINERALKFGNEITPDAVLFLAEMTEGNLFATLQEMHKISLIYPKEKINLEKMINAISNASRYGIFDLTEAFILGNKKKTVQILEHFRSEGTPELQILSLLSKELSNLFLIKTLGNYEKVFGPKFYKDRLKGAAKKLELKQIKDGLSKVAEIDASVKGNKKQDSWQGLRDLSQLFFKN